ncbi:hypothetical protein IAQ61_010292 [Plenodomus lingam]|uniref:Microbial-type PARG catalytic domain-containing protein n=1 Tax=Leptosphaeria maculans (strain JN3 / isolate v23.1.3 / race Av1-4-5-6-7-8) TaxID=985895 RepID=E5A3I1_LEPMJ|nr:hypothetical protein LEMA_P096030.1 [Plenodomus lingam JN3]KAH9862090.1 hypothetical protein IAQ61_010292 [Plenodomus lingam]CBX98194.1 hypothetical protein LEMA_P096030.1 [Plenodomus lingam JN3]
MQQTSILGFFKHENPSQSPPSRPENSQPQLPEGSRPGQPYRSRTNREARPEPSEYRRGRGGHGCHSHGHRSGNHQHHGPNRRRNHNLKLVADETKAQLPIMLSAIPDFDATASSIYDLVDVNTLNPLNCPGYVLPPDDKCAGQKGTRIRVYDVDSLDAALQLNPDYQVHTHLGLSKPVDTTVLLSPSTSSAQFSAKPTPDGIDTVRQDTPSSQPQPISQTPLNPTISTAPNTTTTTTKRTKTPVLVLNLASERSPGGGWTKGALAQEECLCYRSSLSLSLHQNHYPIPPLSTIYTPSVLVLRSSLSTGHTLLPPHTPIPNLPVVSVLSVAALRQPRLSANGATFANAGQRAETKRKIRLTLRVAATQGHGKLVLGALGCGVFANPPREVAQCFLEVFREREFAGGWWEEVVFAVLDNVKGAEAGKHGLGNYGVFWRVLDGEIV